MSQQRQCYLHGGVVKDDYAVVSGLTVCLNCVEQATGSKIVRPSKKDRRNFRRHAHNNGRSPLKWSLLNAAKLRTERESFGLTEDELADDVGCSGSRIRELEIGEKAGRVTSPSPRLELKLQRYFETTFRYDAKELISLVKAAR